MESPLHPQIIGVSCAMCRQKNFWAFFLYNKDKWGTIRRLDARLFLNWDGMNRSAFSSMMEHALRQKPPLSTSLDPFLESV